MDFTECSLEISPRVNWDARHMMMNFCVLRKPGPMQLLQNYRRCTPTVFINASYP